MKRKEEIIELREFLRIKGEYDERTELWKYVLENPHSYADRDIADVLIVFKPLKIINENLSRKFNEELLSEFQDLYNYIGGHVNAILFI